MISNFSIWDQEIPKQIHHETLKVLKNVGIHVGDEVALELLSSAGALVTKDKNGGMVRFPENLVEDCIQWAPKSIVYYARDPAQDYDTGFDMVRFSTYGECIQIVDPYDRNIRATTKRDCGFTGKMVDYYPECAVMERAVCSTDKPAATQALHNLEALLHATSKHIILAANCTENVKPMIAMASMAAGGHEVFKKRPIISLGVCSSSPLTLNKSTCEIIIAGAQAGIGLWLISMVLAGGTGPMTLAGSIVQHNAEILSSLILAQVAKKGTACTYCSSTSIMYMKNAASILGAPEFGLMGRATAQMARFYRLPSAIATGVSDSKNTDIQAAYETAINLTQVALSRPQIIYGLGSIEGGLTFDLAKLVLDCEHARHLLMAIEGIPVDEYQLAYDEIQAVGPGGNYLLQKRTLENMRTQSRVSVFDRNPRKIWEDMGSPQVLESAYQKAIHIIETHQTEPLPLGADRAISKIINDFETELHQKVG